MTSKDGNVNNTRRGEGEMKNEIQLTSEHIIELNQNILPGTDKGYAFEA